MATEDAKAPEPPPKKSKLVPILALLVLLSALGGAGAIFGPQYLQQQSGAAAEKLADPLYIQLRPAFVVNLADDEVLRFLQTEIDLMTRVETIPAAVEQHMPAIRHALVSILSAKQFTEMLKPNGKTQVQDSILLTVNQILAEHGHDAEAIEAVYFSSLVMQ